MPSSSVVERAPVVEVRGVHGVPRLPQLVGEGAGTRASDPARGGTAAPQPCWLLDRSVSRTIQHFRLIQQCRAIARSRTTTCPTPSRCRRRPSCGRSPIRCGRRSSTSCSSGPRPWPSWPPRWPDRRARSPTTSTCSSTPACCASCAPGGSGPSTSATTAAPAAPSSHRRRPAPGRHRRRPCASTACPSPRPSPCRPTRRTRSTRPCGTCGSRAQSAARVLAAGRGAHPRVHRAAALRRHGVRLRRRALPDRLPDPARPTCPGRGIR